MITPIYSGCSALHSGNRRGRAELVLIRMRPAPPPPPGWGVAAAGEGGALPAIHGSARGRNVWRRVLHFASSDQLLSPLPLADSDAPFSHGRRDPVSGKEPQTRPDDPPRQFAGRYERLGAVSEGGMGHIHSALDPVIGRRVAVKTPRVEMQGQELVMTQVGDQAQ